MALCPFAKHLLIPPGSNDPRITPRVAVLHVDAGDAESLYDYFRTRSGGVESHFHVRRDGVIEQYRDTDWQADANHLANDFAVSIETQGYGPGEWTAEQLASIKRLLLWLNDEHGIPLAKCPRWDGAGVGYHTLFGAPGPWTPIAKSCPGPARISQFDHVLVPWFTNPQEDDMPLTDQDIKAIAAETVDQLLAAKVAKEGPTVKAALRMGSKAAGIEDRVAARVGQLLLDGRSDVTATVTAAQIEAAVKQALREGVGD